MLSTLVETPENAIPLAIVTKEGFTAWVEEEEPATGAWLAAIGFRGEAGGVALFPDPTGNRIGRAVVGVSEPETPWALADLPTRLPPGDYRLEVEPEADRAFMMALGWGLGSYRFTAYKKNDKPLARLVWPRAADRAAVERTAAGVYMVRDLVNTPAADMGPAELEAEARSVATDHGAAISVLVGHELLHANFPAIHAVGRASPRAPRLIDMRWGDAAHPKVTIVGKGVCFDSGGLDLKTSGGMLLMKKDMGGAAHALALGAMIMDAGLPIRLRVLIPAVENVIDGSAFKPMDILKTRNGLTVEVGNTDAEGRLILADALALAREEEPEVLLDFATLTGAARVALGPDLPALFCGDEALAAELLASGERVHDPMWRLPLWRPYAKALDGKISDLNSTGTGGFAGAIYAALFLERFAGRGTAWAHIDVYAWNGARRPGRPEGGEAMSLRAVFDTLSRRYIT